MKVKLIAIVTSFLFINAPLVLAQETEITINQPMAGDLVITENKDEAALNNSENDQQAKTLLVKFPLTDDVNVDSEFINSVEYNLGVRIASGNCEAKKYEQEWSFYMTQGNFEEFRTNFSELEQELQDTSRLLLTTTHQAVDKNIFDITDGYKMALDQDQRTFAIRTEVSTYSAVFYPGSLLTNNFLTYKIDGEAILQAINQAATPQDLQRHLLKNGPAIGIKAYKTLPAAMQAELAQQFVSQQNTVESINNAINSMVQNTFTEGRTIGKSATFAYTENTGGQGLAATLTDKSGAYWAPRTSKDKALFQFDLSQVATEFLATMDFYIQRDGGGGTTTLTSTVWLANEISQQPFYLNFKLADEKITLLDKRDFSFARITEYAKTQQDILYVGVASLIDECLENSDSYPKLVYTYDAGKILEAFKTSTISETKEILEKCGEAMGMTSEQLTELNLAKAAIAISKKDIATKEQFLELVASGIANAQKNDIVEALNQSENYNEFVELLINFQEALELELSKLNTLPSQTILEIYQAIYNSGIPYPSFTAFIDAFNQITDSVYQELLSGLLGIDVSQTKDFLLDKGLTLGISQGDLDEKIDVLALAFTKGQPITSINQFRDIYENYVDEAAMSILSMLNRSQSLAEFEDVLNTYTEELGVDLTLYNKIENRQSLYLSLVGAAQNRDEFMTIFNQNVDKYFNAATTLYAQDECFVGPNKTTPDNGGIQGWAGAKGGNTHFVKYDFTGVNLLSDSLISVVINISLANRSETLQQNMTYQLYSAGTSWRGASDYYSTMQEKGVMDNQQLIAEVYKQTQNWGDVISFDITEYVKELAQNGPIEEVAFEYCTKERSVIFARKNTSQTFAPISLIYLEGNGATVSYEYEGSLENVSINTNININFDKAITSESFDKDNIIVKKAGTVFNDYEITKVSDKSARITFLKPLDYDTVYLVELTENIKFQSDPAKYIFNSLSFKTQKKPLEFKGLSVYCQDTLISNLSERAESYVKVTTGITNNSLSTPQKTIVVIGLYKKSGSIYEMVDMKSSFKSINQGSSNNLDVQFDIPLDEEHYFIGCYVYDTYLQMSKLFEEIMD